MLFYMAVYVVMTLGSFLVVLQDARCRRPPVESIASPLRPVAQPARRWRAAMAMFMFSLAGVPPLFGFWPKFLVFDAAVAADLTWLAGGRHRRPR